MARITQEPKSKLNQNFNQRLAIGLIIGGAVVASMLFLLLRPATVTTTSYCTSCTTTISSVSTATINPTSGDVICITASGDFRGIIRRNSSSGNGEVVICNEGKITGATLEFNRGENTIHNYGTMSPSAFSFNSGTSENEITNYAGATATFSTFSLSRNNTQFDNYGTFNSGSFILSSGSDFHNKPGAVANTERVEINSNCEWENEGSWTVSGNFQVNSNAEADNEGTLSISGFLENNNEFSSDGSLSIGGNLNMNGSSSTELSGTVTVGGNVEANKELTQVGSMTISGNLNVNGSGRLDVRGFIAVGNNFTNNGQISGPATSTGSYGRINVAAVSTQNGSGRLLQNIDVCDAGFPVNGLDVNTGSKASSVTHCLNAPAGSLPVEWGSVDAKGAANGVTITWSTLKELNNDHFTVERSQDARIFQPVTEVPGAGNTQSASNYEAVDPRPPVGTVYYRIRQTDFDGQTSFSSMVEFSWSAPEFSISFSPNPVTDQGALRVTADQNGSATVRVLDINGREVSRQDINLFAGENSFDFATSSWSPGVYIMEVRRHAQGVRPSTIKLIKQ